MRLAAAAAVLLVGCSDPRDCSIGVVEGDFVGSAMFDACGDLYRDFEGNYDLAAYQAAQACVLDHAQQHRPFFVRWRLAGVDTYRDGAYAGVMYNGAWTLAAFQQDGGVRGAQPAERDSCTDLMAGAACNSWPNDLCIACAGRKVADQCEP
jgi:hypothetical protein